MENLVIGGYKFNNQELLLTALTHSSYSENHYERLEFLGDSILDFLVAEHFFVETTKNEGELTKMRAYFVSESYLSGVFDSLKIDNLARIGKSCASLTKSIKSDMLESIIAVIYLENGINACKKFIETNFKLCNNIENLCSSKTVLQEWAQKNKLKVEYTLVNTQGKAHEPTFFVKTKVGKYETIASGKTKQDAQENGAKIILDTVLKGDN